MANFVVFELIGQDVQKFLQAQLTCNVHKLTDHYQVTAISNLKGRVAFGIWVKKITDEHFAVVIHEDCATDFAQHIKKYAAFSKLTLSEPKTIATIVEKGVPSFSQNIAKNSETSISDKDWETASIATGNYWIIKTTEGLWQPQELRLHQRGGVDYDKGCYLGQEIIARLYFKASPKAWLHRVKGVGDTPLAGDKIGQIEVVNSITTDEGFEALVIARPNDIITNGLTILPLPNELEKPVNRET